MINLKNVSDVAQIIEQANSQKDRISQYPLDKILRVLNTAARYWDDPNYKARILMQEKLPGITGFSFEMIDLGLSSLSEILKTKALKQKIETEFQAFPRTEGFKFKNENKTALRWHPLGKVLHVLSGNVFLVAAGSIVEGLITGNVTILKMSSEETHFSPIFIESLREAERELGYEDVVSQSIIPISYSSNQIDVIESLKSQVEGILVWGGEDAVKAYRNNLSPHTRLILFGPKLSLAFITKKGINKFGLNFIAMQLAKELSLWDQNACTAPQVCFVQGKENAKKLLQHLAEELENQNHILPCGNIDPNTAAEIRKIRSLYEIIEIKEEGLLKCSEGNLDWTVYLDNDQQIEPSPLHRTLKIIPIDDIGEILPQFCSLKSFIQTIGLVSDDTEHLSLANEFGNQGALRIVCLDKMSSGKIDDPHDGAYDLPQLMNLVVTHLDSSSSSIRAFDLLDKKEQIKVIERQLRDFNDERKNLEINSLTDLSKISIMTKEDFKKMLNSCDQYNLGGQITRTGGTTGQPQFSYFNESDWNAMIDNAVDVFKACGLNKSDRIANCFNAGEMYGSFISFNDVNLKLGLTSFPFAGIPSANFFLTVWQRFKFNTIQGIPSSLIPFLREIKKMDSQFTLEKIMYAGEPLNQTDRDWLINVLNIKSITSVIGTTEAGQLAYQCPKCKNQEHHVIDDYNYIEIVDDQLNSVKSNEVGNILVTTLQKKGLPLIRFKIGDQAKWIDTPCKCGSPARRIEYLGRSDNIIVVCGMNINYDDIQLALKDFPISLIQLVCSYKNKSEQLTIKAESEHDPEILNHQIIKALNQKFPILIEKKNHGLIIEIQVLPPGSLLRNEITGKVKTIQDERFQ